MSGPRRRRPAQSRRHGGREFWQSLDELLDDPPRRAQLERALPEGSSLPADAVSRRAFLKLVGASLALAGLDGCTRLPGEKILPYVHQPPELTPGLPQFYATSMVLGGFATGLLVESHVGRPTKIEGNPLHPASLGAAGPFEQAAVLQLYDPLRARRVRRGRATSSWQAAWAELSPTRLRMRVGAKGGGLRLLLEPTSSPLEIELLDRLRTLYPELGVHVYAPLATEAASAALDGTRPLLPQYDAAAADVLLTVESDLLAAGPGHLRHARAVAARRGVTLDSAARMNRLYALESAHTVTGSVADHRLAVRPSEIEGLLHDLLARVGGEAERTRSAARELVRPGGEETANQRWIRAVAHDLDAHRGRSLVVAGDRQPVRVHALVHALNAALGNVGRTVWFTPSPLFGAGDAGTGLPALAEALRGGTVDTLVILGGNPVYTAPASIDFLTLLRRVPQSVCLGMYEHETAHACHWMIPAAHFLESWGDARAHDGTLSTIQPLVQPLFGGRSTVELLALLAGEPREAHDLMRDSWRRRSAAGDVEQQWRSAVQRGLVEGTAFTPVPAQARAELVAPRARPEMSAGPGGRDRIELVFSEDRRVYDGTFANNGWLQEFPEPLTTLTWGNAAHVSPATARRLAVETGDELELTCGGRAVHLPALVVPGHADETVTVHFGYGRRGAEAVARGVGVNVYPLWPGDMTYLTSARCTASRSGTRHQLALTQLHWPLEGRDVVRAVSLDAYRAHPTAAGVRSGRALTLYEPPPHLPEGAPASHQWAMTIDLSRCTGCGACVLACQAENNVPVVGQEQVLNRREMHWLRVDRYFVGSPERARVVSQPMLCQHCEKAPCEYVCPVEATVHSPDGLNEMVYNRCVGTRFCSNNCPYKVRRFNWFDYNQEIDETVAMARNPDVSVRERGVMEKCTFCVQRIREAEIAAGVEHRSLQGSEVRTACAQACPSEAIVFGSLSEPESPVSRLRRDPRAYAVLGELGTAPRVRYLARVRNANAELTALEQPSEVAE